MISVAEAIDIILSETKKLPAESIRLETARGRVLAEEVVADTDLPPFDRARMDGYAVRAKDTANAPIELRVVGEAAAGAGWYEREMQAGEAVRIMTGAPIPSGADAVQQVEVTSETTDGSTVKIKRAATVKQFISERGTEIRKGETVLRAGMEINAAMLAALASFGYAKVQVAKRPRVAVLATGTELVAVGETPGADQIRDSNSYSLAAYAELAGAIVERLPLAGDDTKTLQLAIEDAATRCDTLVLSGGVSMGVYDFTKTALCAAGAEVFFERVRLRPGKPTVFARLNNTLIFGLPGNPVSVSVTFNLFARTALRRLQGIHEDAALKEEHAVLARDVKGSPERASYLPATLHTNAQGTLIAEPLRWGGSSDFVAFTQATALIIVPEGVPKIEIGAIVSVVRLPDNN